MKIEVIGQETVFTPENKTDAFDLGIISARYGCSVRLNEDGALASLGLSNTAIVQTLRNAAGRSVK